MAEYVNDKRISDPSPDGKNYVVTGYQAVVGENEKLREETAFAERQLQALIKAGAKDSGEFIVIKAETHIPEKDKNGKVIGRKNIEDSTKDNSRGE